MKWINFTKMFNNYPYFIYLLLNNNKLKTKTKKKKKRYLYPINSVYLSDIETPMPDRDPQRHKFSIYEIGKKLRWPSVVGYVRNTVYINTIPTFCLLAYYYL